MKSKTIPQSEQFKNPPKSRKNKQNRYLEQIYTTARFPGLVHTHERTRFMGSNLDMLLIKLTYPVASIIYVKLFSFFASKFISYFTKKDIIINK